MVVVVYGGLMASTTAHKEEEGRPFPDPPLEAFSVYGGLELDGYIRELGEVYWRHRVVVVVVVSVDGSGQQVSSSNNNLSGIGRWKLPPPVRTMAPSVQLGTTEETLQGQQEGRAGRRW